MNKNTSLRQALDTYYGWLHENRSQETLDVYSEILDQMAAILGSGVAVQTIQPGDLKTVVTLLSPGRAFATVEKYKRTIRTFFNRLVNWGDLDRSPVTFTVREFEPGPLDTKAISEDDICTMLSAGRNTRDQALVKVFADTAFRLGGVWNLRLEGIDLPNMALTTLEKGDQLHTVPLLPPTLSYLMRWMGDRAALVSEYGHEHGYVFVRLPDGGRLSKRGIYEVMRRLGKRTGVKRFSPHKFRHAWGAWAADAGEPVTDAQAQLGHASASTTWKFYYKINFEAMRRVAARRTASYEGHM